MNNLLIILLVILLIICLFNGPLNQLSLSLNNTNKQTVENFSCTAECEEEEPSCPLTTCQTNQINQMISDKTMSLMNSSSSFMQGPQGIEGQQGPPGGVYQAAGRLVNQSASYTSSNKNALTPTFVTTRTSGTLPQQSLCMMDTPALGSFQFWYLNSNGTIENKYDGKCINYNPLKSSGTKVYMGDCTPSDYNQWIWDKNNRLIFKNGENQCLSVSSPESGITTTTIPGCTDDSNCIRPGANKYLEIKTYKDGSLYDDEIWGFI